MKASGSSIAASADSETSSSPAPSDAVRLMGGGASAAPPGARALAGDEGDETQDQEAGREAESKGTECRGADFGGHTGSRRTTADFDLIHRGVRSAPDVKLPMSVFVVLAATATTLGAAPHPAIYGLWTATAGTTVFHGKWSAQALPASPNSLIGSWALLNDSGATAMQGTWSARRSGRGWRGTWEAKAQPAGGTFSGTWQAVPPDDFQGKTFEDLLRATANLQLSGTWSSRGGAAGGWWLKPPPA